MTIQHKLARLKQRLPHARLAFFIGVDPRTLGRWLYGTSKPLPIFQTIISDLYDKAFGKPGALNRLLRDKLNVLSS